MRLINIIAFLFICLPYNVYSYDCIDGNVEDSIITELKTKIVKKCAVIEVIADRNASRFISDDLRNMVADNLRNMVIEGVMESNKFSNVYLKLPDEKKVNV